MLKKLLNPLFVLHLIFVATVLIGWLPRQLVLYEAALLAAYFILAPLEDSVIFFVRSIPLFIAIPLTASFDNFNMWRIFSLIIFLRLFLRLEVIRPLKTGIARLIKRPLDFIKEYPVQAALYALTILAVLSLWHAPDRAAGLKRVIYFINASFIGIVIYFYGRQERRLLARVRNNIIVPVIIVTLAGAVQVVSTYFMDIYQFMRVWGEVIDLRLFGAQWSYIAVHVGNTWFAYFGSQLSLRVFSLFPDSHSFPIFLLLGLPALFAWTLRKPLEKAGRMKDMLFTRGKLAVLWIPLIFLMMILSGTRGIWAAGAAMVFWSIAVFVFMKRGKAGREHLNTFAYLSYFLAVFFLLFAVVYPIFSSPQFLVSKSDALLLEKRFTSILDFGETSNAQRIQIWKASLVSIAHHPFLGVGIGNFPVVLNQDILLAKAGSSAHNVYLHIAAEMGLPALAAALYLIWLIIQASYKRFLSATDIADRAYLGGLLLTIPWVLAYLMTDVALFDERALLLFAITLGLLFGNE